MEQSPYMLLDLYKSQSRMPLGHRICLAHALAVALENFHRVGWVHKEIRSSNIFFIPGDQSTVIPGSARTPSALAGSINLSTPWLFGFEYARSEDAGTKLEEDHNLTNNLYRHPFRWGRPRAKFTKAHDVYSLVCHLGKHVSASWWMTWLTQSVPRTTGNRAFRNRQLEGHCISDEDFGERAPLSPNHTQTDGRKVRQESTASGRSRLDRYHPGLSRLRDSVGGERWIRGTETLPAIHRGAVA